MKRDEEGCTILERRSYSRNSYDPTAGRAAKHFIEYCGELHDYHQIGYGNPDAANFLTHDT